VIHGILGHGLQGWGTGKVTQIVNNTFCDIGGSGIDLTNAASGSLIENNLFSGISGSDVEATGGASQRNNLADGRNPVFVNAGAGDYRLEASSPAVDAGVASSVYAGFQNVFGRSIAVDRAGGSRPAGSAWDIGAYEYGASSSGGGTGSNVPTPPSNVRIH